MTEREGLQRMARVEDGDCREHNCGRPVGFFHSVTCRFDPTAVEARLQGLKRRLAPVT